ncbi:hypothetical protein GGR51DRAFT_441329 [Nemania sp. FL0031]|nr:hypothetical protein GGR51DRAFT_441329 [Nemania sp. FL0031]
MTSQPPTIPLIITTTTTTIDDDDDETPPETDSDDYDSHSTTSQTPPFSLPPTPHFPRFPELPPELRHQIWRFAVPSPGINFFNVHCFPGDHAGCNRSTSPPWAYLDLRRLAISDSDAAVARYDPSAWQARDAVRQSCREARLICALPAHKAANITLTRPRRGLFVRAGDGQLRKTPLRIQDDRREREHEHEHEHEANSSSRRSDGDGDSSLATEPVVRRVVQVHVDDILCLSVENCSFNLPYEEMPSLSMDEDDDDDDSSPDELATSAPEDADEGWAYDPQLTPPLPPSIPADRLCASMARCNMRPIRNATDALFGLLYGHIPGYLELRPGELWPGRLLLMFDAVTQAVGGRNLDELTATPEVVWDRFGDCYVRLPWRTGDFNPPDGFPIMYRLTKVWPETCGIRGRYLSSAFLPSPKRLAGSS